MMTSDWFTCVAFIQSRSSVKKAREICSARPRTKKSQKTKNKQQASPSIARKKHIFKAQTFIRNKKKRKGNQFQTRRENATISWKRLSCGCKFLSVLSVPKENFNFEAIISCKLKVTSDDKG